MADIRVANNRGISEGVSNFPKKNQFNQKQAPENFPWLLTQKNSSICQGRISRTFSILIVFGRYGKILQSKQQFTRKVQKCEPVEKVDTFEVRSVVLRKKVRLVVDIFVS